jgi:anti-anti-sigma factor
METNISDGRLTLSGNLFIQDIATLVEQLKQLLDFPDDEIHVDLSQVEAIDTASLQVIIAFLKSAEQTQKKIEFAKLSEPLQSALEITGLDAFFEKAEQPDKTNQS